MKGVPFTVDSDKGEKMFAAQEILCLACGDIDPCPNCDEDNSVHCIKNGHREYICSHCGYRYYQD